MPSSRQRPQAPPARPGPLHGRVLPVDPRCERARGGLSRNRSACAADAASSVPALRGRPAKADPVTGTFVCVLTRNRILLGMAGLWSLLLIPSVPLAQHECFGFIGFLAHSPLYAFMALSAGFIALGAALAVRSAATAVRARR